MSALAPLILLPIMYVVLILPQRKRMKAQQALVAAIGPCLGRCCGEVGPEVVQAFREAGHGEDALRRWFETGPSGRPHLDLARANREQLEEAGVGAAQIYVAGLCTKSYAEVLHSYRTDKENAGRMVAVIRSQKHPEP